MEYFGYQGTNRSMRQKMCLLFLHIGRLCSGGKFKALWLGKKSWEESLLRPMSTKKVYISPWKQGSQIASVNQELMNSLVCTTWLLKGEKKHVQKLRGVRSQGPSMISAQTLPFNDSNINGEDDSGIFQRNLMTEK